MNKSKPEPTPPDKKNKKNDQPVLQKKENFLFLVYTENIGHVLTTGGSSQLARQKVALHLKEGFKGVIKVAKLSQNSKTYFDELLKRLEQQVVPSA